MPSLRSIPERELTGQRILEFLKQFYKDVPFWFSYQIHLVGGAIIIIPFVNEETKLQRDEVTCPNSGWDMEKLKVRMWFAYVLDTTTQVTEIRQTNPSGSYIPPPASS